MAKEFDLIVVGAGSGMLLAQYAAANQGWETALIEKGPLGGTCLNRGCIPSKMIIHSADIAETIMRSSRFGISGKIDSIDFETIVRKTNDYVDREADMMEKAMKYQEIISYYKEEASFDSPHTLKVGDDEISGRRFVIAAGCRPRIPQIKGLEDVDYWTSTEALRPEKQPESLIIIGGGFIAAELGHFYGMLGTQVTIVQRSANLLNREDEDISTAFTKIFSEKYKVMTSATVKEVSRSGKGWKKVTVENKSGETLELEAEALLVATGLQPNTDILGLKNTEMEIDEQGYVKTDEFMETTQTGSWALGDIVGRAPFKHAANREAQIVAHNLSSRDKIAMDYHSLPHAIFSSPQLAAVGLTEQEARSLDLNYEVRKFAYSDTAMGKTIGADHGFVKYILDSEDETIVGCHIIGPQASILIHEIVVAMSAGDGTVGSILRAVHIHPSLAEVMQWGL